MSIGNRHINHDEPVVRHAKVIAFLRDRGLSNEDIIEYLSLFGPDREDVGVDGEMGVRGMGAKPNYLSKKPIERQAFDALPQSIRRKVLMAQDAAQGRAAANFRTRWGDRVADMAKWS